MKQAFNVTHSPANTRNSDEEAKQSAALREITKLCQQGQPSTPYQKMTIPLTAKSSLHEASFNVSIASPSSGNMFVQVGQRQGTAECLKATAKTGTACV